MIQIALALALVAQDIPVDTSLDVTAWFRANLKNFETTKIERIKPPSRGEWKTGMGGILTVAILPRRESHLVVFHCYRVYPAGAQSYRYMLVEGSNGKVMASKTSGRALEQHCG